MPATRRKGRSLAHDVVEGLAGQIRAQSLRPGDKTELKPGMTFHFMTGLWLETMGLEITESILITDAGVECLANVPRKLFVKN